MHRHVTTRDVWYWFENTLSPEDCDRIRRQVPECKECERAYNAVFWIRVFKRLPVQHDFESEIDQIDEEGLWDW